MDKIQTISPVDNSIYVERPFATEEEIANALRVAKVAQHHWKNVPLRERLELASRFVDEVLKRRDAIAQEITWQMGRPIRYSPNELKGFEERARYMISVAERSLGDIEMEFKAGFRRFIRREPLGMALVIAPWNYPWLTSVNSILPAIIAGNVVILKHSAQTPLVAERYLEAFEAAGLPKGVFQYLHLKDSDTDELISKNLFDFVAFTGSVRVGHSVQRAASGGFFGVGLELGGKDPAYVRADADFNHAVENLVDGAFFNSGQSCCSIERIYVDQSIYDRFVDAFVDLTTKYIVGDPTKEETTLGPLVRTGAAENVRQQIEEATTKGAKVLINEKLFSRSQEGSPYLAPQVLIDVDHGMQIMREETFGPAVGIMKVRSDEEAVSLMNDSPYGLSAAIWTSDLEAAITIGEQVETGTWFMNRCDYLDPALAWTGVKDSGRGCTLSSLGYEQLTRPKSFHLRIKTA